MQDTFIRACELSGLTVKNVIVWDKKIHGMGDLQGSFAPQHETIIFAVKGKYKFPGKRPRDVISIPRIPGDKLTHPNEKPTVLMEQLISAVTAPGATVCDPFMGSGSTGVACVNTGRNFIGMELDEGYFRIARERIEAAGRSEK